MPSDLALKLTLISSNYPCLEHIFMVPKVFEPLKFYCITLPESVSIGPKAENEDTWSLFVGTQADLSFAFFGGLP